MFHHGSPDLASLDSLSLRRSTCRALPPPALGPLLCQGDTI